jgi:hypothetical protein
MRTPLLTPLLAASFAAVFSGTPASAATNLIVNGSFENGLSGWTPINNALHNPIAVITYNSATPYPTGAFGEAIPVDGSVSASPDTAGHYAAYFVDDFAVNQGLTQSTFLAAGNYEVGFSAYLPLNGFRNRNDATFTGSVLGLTIASFTASAGTAQNWVNYNGVVAVNHAGFYNTSFLFNSFGHPAKDVVIDRVYAVLTSRPTTVPEPESWALMISGLAMIGIAVRRRNRSVVAA